MKKILTIALIFSFLFLPFLAIAEDVYVDGYYKKNGTYVEPYHRTSPNNSIYDNYSTKGNTNPYTGQQGTVDPNNQYNSGLGGRSHNLSPYPSINR
jgi:hypothetical protein